MTAPCHRFNVGWRLLLGTLLLALTVTGCSASSDSGSAQKYRRPAADSVPVVDPSVRLPFQDYQLSVTERTRMQETHGRLLQRCMRRKGFEVTIGGDYLVGSPVADFPLGFMWGGPFGTMPLKHAERFGYKPEAHGPFVKGPGFYYSNPLNIFWQSQGIGNDVHAEAAFYGMSGIEGMDGAADVEDTGPGCFSEVEDAIDSPMVDLIDLSADLSKLTREHPQLERAVKQWVTCMKHSGYTYRDVWEPISRFGSPFASQRQIDIATADVKCTTKSGWANYYYYILADYQRQAIEQDPQLFESALAAEKARMITIERDLITRADNAAVKTKNPVGFDRNRSKE